MLGIWDYTVVLTYCSLLSAVTGILVSLDGHGHPYIGVMFLLLCGLCDTFDGRVARSKKNRTKKEKDFGVQIDSLSDLVAFGVLPVCVGMAMYKRTMFDETMSVTPNTVLFSIPVAVLILISAVFVLAALVRLAYFNITVEETQGEGSSGVFRPGSASCFWPEGWRQWRQQGAWEGRSAGSRGRPRPRSPFRPDRTWWPDRGAAG